MIVEVFDHSAAHLQSLTKALELCGARVRLRKRPTALFDGDAIVLPAGGVLDLVAASLAPVAHPLREALHAGFPCLGVGLGMELLMESLEDDRGCGLGVCAGTTRPLGTRRIPHIGWNRVELQADPLFEGISELLAYFANGRICAPADGSEEIAWTIHEHIRFPAAIRQGNTWGVQFRPEKSGSAGLHLIRNFIQAIAAPGAAPLAT